MAASVGLDVHRLLAVHGYPAAAVVTCDMPPRSRLALISAALQSPTGFPCYHALARGLGRQEM